MQKSAGVAQRLERGTNRMYDIETLRRSATDRRAFLTRMSAAGLGAAAVALLAGCDGSSSSNNGSGNSTPSLSDTRAAFVLSGTVTGGAAVPVPGATQNAIVLNYALTLETLEADLYRQALNAASGRLLTAALDGTTPTGNQTAALSSTTPTGNNTGSYTLAVGPGTIPSAFQQAAFLYLVQFAYVEAAHRDFLNLTIGPAASPLQGPTKTYKLPTGTDATTLSGILSAILPLEEIGVRAYLGAGKYVQDNATLQTAVSIYSTECRHSASIEYLLDPTGATIGPRQGITGVPAGEYEVAQPPVSANGALNIFEKALPPSLVLGGAYPLLA